MKKFLSISLIVVMAAAVMIGCGKKADKTEDIVASVKKSESIASKLPDRIKTSGKIVFGLDDAYPPMEFRDDENNLVGFDVDLGNAIGKKLGIKVEWMPTAWDGIIMSLNTNKYDAILSALSITDERKLEIGFSEPYIQGGPVIIVKQDNTSIKTGADLKDKVVGVQMGSTGDDAATALEGLKEIKRYDTITKALLDLSTGRVDAVVADDQVGRYYVGLDANKYEVTGKLAEEPYGIGFRKDDQALIDAVQAAFDELKAEGILSKISQKWFKEDYYKQ